MRKPHSVGSLTALLIAVVVALAAENPTEAGWADEPPNALTFETRGQGAPVVFLPGLASPAAVWGPAATALEGDHETHLGQLSGFAGTAPRDWESGILEEAVAALVAHLEAAAPDGATVVGHSMGGLIGLMASLERPELFERLVIVDALPFYSVLMFGHVASAEGVEPFAAQFRDQLLAMDAAAFETQQRGTAQVLATSPDAQESIVAWSLDSDRVTMAQAMYEVMTTDLRERLVEAQTPTTVIVGWHPEGPFPRDSTSLYWADNYQGHPDVEIVLVDGARHFVMLDQPERFLQALRAAIAP